MAGHYVEKQRALAHVEQGSRLRIEYEQKSESWDLWELTKLWMILSGEEFYDRFGIQWTPPKHLQELYRREQKNQYIYPGRKVNIWG